MQAAHKNSRPRTFDIYEYIFRLEEEVKLLRAERDIIEARAEQLETELDRLNSELQGNAMPRSAAMAKELRSNKEAY